MIDSVRVLLCDDAGEVRSLIRAELDLEPDIVVIGEATNGVEAIALAEDTQPDVVLLDIAMPVMDGLEALPRIRKAAPQASVIVLSASEVSEMASVVVAGGASRYIPKGTPAERIVEAVRAVR